MVSRAAKGVCYVERFNVKQAVAPNLFEHWSEGHVQCVAVEAGQQGWLGSDTSQALVNDKEGLHRLYPR